MTNYEVVNQAAPRESERVLRLRSEQVRFESELNDGLTAYERTIERLANPREHDSAQVAELSKLDKAIASGRALQGDIQGLIEDLTQELNSL